MNKHQKKKKEDEAVVGVFTVAIVISLLVIVLGVVNTVYVPQWIKTAEYQHMNQVSNQFAQLKSALDIQSLTNGSSVISNTINMGAVEMPFFRAHQSYDELSIPSNTCTFSITNKSSFNWICSTDAIKFTSHNTNFVDQSYIYEAGALILDQDGESVLSARPSFLVTDYGKNLTILFFNVTAGTGANDFVSGHGTYLIYTQITQNNQKYTLIHNVTNISLQTRYPDAWHNAFVISLLYSGIEYQINDTSSGIVVNFIDNKGDYYNVFIREVKIAADLAFGVVE